MARRKQQHTTPADIVEQITDIDVRDELSQSYLEYALSVIVARAIPDARDGLKPVQRRLLYAMDEAGLRSDRPYRKSIAAVGDTMKKYHPHGDSAIYETLVRLAQPWVQNCVLVDGHGNFGSRDDGPAAARYTEARLSPFAELLLTDVDEDTVDMGPNFDATIPEPRVLPAAYPNLLVNGAAGIAVGMATSIPPHNLNETINACLLLLGDKPPTDDDLLRVLPAPDFPTGGQLISTPAEIKDAYQTGKGTFKVRARATIEDVAPRRRGIVVTELPYNVGPERVIARVKELVQNKKLVGISDIKDLSDRRHGLRLVIEVKAGFDPQMLLDDLYRQTPMEDNFSFNAVALIDGKPQTCSLRTMLAAFVSHRLDVIVRRARYRLSKAKARLHLLEALLAALGRIDEVIAAIKSSKDTPAARSKLRRLLAIDEEQANYILEMPLRRLTTLEVSKIRDEQRQVAQQVRELESLLKSPKKQRGLVRDELTLVQANHQGARRTTLAPVDPAQLAARAKELAAASRAGDIETTLRAKSENCQVTISPDGMIALGSQRKNVYQLDTATDAHIVAFDRQGVARPISVAELSHTPVSLAAWGIPDGSCVGIANVGVTIGMATRDGLVKRVDDIKLDALLRVGSDGMSIIALENDDELVGAAFMPDESEFVLVGNNARILRFSASQVRVQGRSARGMRGINIGQDDRVIMFAASSNPHDDALAVLTDGNHAKRVNLAAYPPKGRGTAGVLSIAMRASDSTLVAALVAPAAGNVAALDAAGRTVSFEWEASTRQASGAALPRPAASLCRAS